MPRGMPDFLDMHRILCVATIKIKGREKARKRTCDVLKRKRRRGLNVSETPPEEMTT
jgi:hypothetical protein